VSAIGLRGMRSVIWTAVGIGARLAVPSIALSAWPAGSSREADVTGRSRRVVRGARNHPEPLMELLSTNPPGAGPSGAMQFRAALADSSSLPPTRDLVNGDRSASRLGGWLREIVSHRDLFYFLVWRDIKVRYKQTLLGALWAVIQPVASMLILTLFFGRLAAIKSNGVPYPIFAYAALVPWTYFSGALSTSAMSMISNSNLLTKIYFPRIAIPSAPVLAALADFGIASVLLLVLMPWYGVPIGARLLLWPLLMLPLALLALALGILCACLNARYRDMKHALPFLIQMLMFATPIIYPLDLIPQSYRWVAAVNPLTGLVEAFRASVLIAQPMRVELLLISMTETLVLLAFALFYLRRTERVIADVV
jgi:lipopolysaccharide transport system permease protein